jgi:hypothetical protein
MLKLGEHALTINQVNFQLNNNAYDLLLRKDVVRQKVRKANKNN